jgi:type IV secretory pathway VirB2 component (pilin)
MDGVSAASGGATASVMEMSRAISDAPYGIRGVANNLTQMVSQIGFTAKSAGGLTNALKLMWKAMLGPLGVVIAITTVITAMDWLYGANKKAETSTADFKDSLNLLSTALENQVLSQGDVNGKIEEYLALILAKNIQEKEGKKQAEEIIEIQKEQVELEDFLIKQRKVRAGLFKKDELGNIIIKDALKLKKSDEAILKIEEKIAKVKENESK